MKLFRVSTFASICLFAVTLCGIGCSGNDQTTTVVKTVNVNQSSTSSSEPFSSSVNTNALPVMTGAGDAIDTSIYDAEIEQLEKVAEKSPSDEAARISLSKAYLSRAKALTDVRQYPAALGDYRRVLRFDPDNDEAQQMVTTITTMLTDAGQVVPEEGEEPGALPFPARRA